MASSATQAPSDGAVPPAGPAPPGAIDAPLPPAMAARASDVGVSKAGLDATRTFVLAVLAGAFIALGAMFATVVTAGAGDVPFGLARLAAGVVFCLGLLLVVVAGAELFTGNNLIVMAWADRRITLGRLLRNWGIVYAGNLVGALAEGGMHLQGFGVPGVGHVPEPGTGPDSLAILPVDGELAIGYATRVTSFLDRGLGR